MMRGIFRYRQAIRVVPCRPQRGDSGGLAVLERPGEGYTIHAAVRPDRQSERRELGTLRPRERRLLLLFDHCQAQQGDHLYFEYDERVWRVMQRRDYPQHQELEAEVEG